MTSWNGYRKLRGTVVAAAVVAAAVATIVAPGATAAPPSTSPPAKPPRLTGGAAKREAPAVVRQGTPSTPLSRRAATTADAPSLLGGALADAPADRVVGRLIATGGVDVLPDAPVDTLAWVTDRTVTRLAGPDRYGTAVAVSADGFPSGAPVAFVATGENFPDGLAASAVAGVLGGPVLLSRRASIDAGTLAELVRLAPATVHVAGGADVVTDEVLTEIATALPSAVVDRVSGSDRAATAAALAGLIPAQNKVAFLATGANFPDALAAGPAAASLGGPLLLTTSGTLSPAARTELARIRPATVFIAGGSDVVNDTVATQVVAATGGKVERLSGPDRYATAAAVSARVFSPTAPAITLATGANFADALGAGAYAASVRGPLLLTTLDATAPASTNDEARRLSWYLPAEGKVIRYITVAHPDDEMSIRSLIPPDPRRFDIYIILNRGEDTQYCNGEPVTTPWVSSQFLPQPQPTGLQYSDRCKSHRLQSWNTYLQRTGLGTIPTYTPRTGSPVEWDGATLPTPVRLDANENEVEATNIDIWIGPNQARVLFDVGGVDPSEVIWAIQNVRAMREEIAPGAVEGDLVSASYYNATTTGAHYTQSTHEALYETLGTVDLGLPGSQYVSVGHVQAGRAFGAMVPSYCLEMCHPADLKGWVGPMGRFQYAYGWLRSGKWPTGAVDVEAGFSQYQSFAKFF